MNLHTAEHHRHLPEEATNCRTRRSGFPPLRQQCQGRATPCEHADLTTYFLTQIARASCSGKIALFAFFMTLGAADNALLTLGLGSVCRH